MGARPPEIAPFCLVQRPSKHRGGPAMPGRHHRVSAHQLSEFRLDGSHGGKIEARHFIGLRTRCSDADVHRRDRLAARIVKWDADRAQPELDLLIDDRMTLQPDPCEFCNERFWIRKGMGGSSR